MIRPFHLALPTTDITATRAFYIDTFNCAIGRSDTTWVDFDFYGHQLVFHETDITLPSAINPVDKKSVQVPHFGIILTMPDWTDLADRLVAKNCNFIIEPYVRFKGEPGEQATMFILDNNGYAIEIKAFGDDAMIFAS